MRHPQVPQNTLAQALSGSETCNTRHRSLQVACGKVGTVAIHRCGRVPFDSQNMKILDQIIRNVFRVHLIAFQYSRELLVYNG